MFQMRGNSAGFIVHMQSLDIKLVVGSSLWHCPVHFLV